MTETSKTLTDQEATDEAVLLLTRKLRRLHPAISAELLKALPAGAREALQLAEIRADKVRDANPQGYTYPEHFVFDDDDPAGWQG